MKMKDVFNLPMDNMGGALYDLDHCVTESHYPYVAEALAYAVNNHDRLTKENEALKAALNEVAAKFNALDISEDAKLPTAEEYLAKVLTNKGE